MNSFVQMLLTALLAVTAENIIFSGGIGFSRVLRAARKPKTLGIYALFVAFFSLISVLLSSLWSSLVAEGPALVIIRPAVFAGLVALVYVVSAYTAKSFFPNFYRKYGMLLSPAAMNTVVLSMPYIQKSFKLNVTDAAGFALGTGIAFFLAALALAYTLDKYRNQTEMPKAFSGLPAVLLYVGILSMAFAGDRKSVV